MSFSDDSDLTELSSDEDDIPLAHSSNRASTRQVTTKSRQSQVTPCLRPPRTTQYTAKSLYDQLHENTIDLDPEYQRDVVWSDDKQKGLIDSLFHNYYIPPIIFAVVRSPDGDEKRTCIDGKQRLTSLQRFMDGYIEHKDSVTGQKTWYMNQPGQSHKLLASPTKRIFDLKQIVCVEYEELSDDQEREIFQRVQLGVALTPAERMQAINGPWPTLVRDVQAHVQEGFADHLEWGQARGRDFQGLAAIALMIDKYDSTSTPVEPSVSRLEMWLHNTKPVPTKLTESVMRVFNIYLRLVKDANLSAPFKKKRVAPVEFYMIGFFIHVYQNSFSLSQLSSAIEHLRADVRAKWQDIRGNTKVFNHIKKFIMTGVKKLNFAKAKAEDLPAALGKCKVESTETLAPKPTPVRPKRKRAVIESEGESEDEALVRPPPKARPSSSRAAANSSSSKILAASTSTPTSTPASKAATSVKRSQTKVKSTPARTAPTASAPSKTATKPKLPSSKDQIGSPQVARPSGKLAQSSSTVARPPTPGRTVPVPRISKLSTNSASTSSISNSGPQSAPVQPPKRPLPRSRVPSAPPIETIHDSSPVPAAGPSATASSQHPASVSVKTEPRHSPSVPPAPLTVADRLAPIRAAKAATKVESASPSLPFGTPSLLLPGATADPRRPASIRSTPDSVKSGSGNQYTPRETAEAQAKLDRILADAGITKGPPPAPCPVPAPLLLTTPMHHPSSDMSMSPPDRDPGPYPTPPTPQYAPPLFIQEQALNASQATLLSSNQSALASTFAGISQSLTNYFPHQSQPITTGSSLRQLPSISINPLDNNTTQPQHPSSATSSTGFPPPTPTSATTAFLPPPSSAPEPPMSASSTASSRDHRRMHSNPERRMSLDYPDRERRSRDFRSGSRSRSPGRKRGVTEQARRSDRSSTRDRYRDRSRSRDRDRDRDRERERDKDRDRVRDEPTGRDRDRDRDRGVERVRDRDRDTTRGKERWIYSESRYSR